MSVRRTGTRRELNTLAGDEDAILFRRFMNSHLNVPLVDIELLDDVAVTGGGYADIYKGDMIGSSWHGQSTVALKTPRAYGRDRSPYYRRLARELSAWSRVHHPNVLPLLGLSLDVQTHRVFMVAPWMTNGVLSAHMRQNPEFNLTHMLQGISDGIAYLHSLGIVHGDLKCDNILLDDLLQPLISDFGLAGNVDDEVVLAINPRWAAPECIDPGEFGLTNSTMHSTASDMYAVGMTIYEMASQKEPFEGVRAVDVAVMTGQRPSHPGPAATRRGLTDPLWSFVQRCWSTERAQRPPIGELQQLLAATEPALNTPDGSLAHIAPLVRPTISLYPLVLEPRVLFQALTRRVLQAVVGRSAEDEMWQSRLQSVEDRCTIIARELELWSSILTVAPSQSCVREMQGTLQQTLREVQLLRRKSPEHHEADEELIQSSVRCWNMSLTQRLDRFHQAILQNIVGSSREVHLCFLERENTHAALRAMLGTLNPDIGRQVSTLIHSGYEQLRMENVPYERRNVILDRLRSLITVNSVPTSVWVQEDLGVGDLPVIVTQRTCIYRCHWGSRDVALKRFTRPDSVTDHPARLTREAASWRMICHPNVLPFCGLCLHTIRNETRIALVSMWATHRDVIGFLQDNPDWNRRAIVRGVADGIGYLHERQILHGGIRGSNVLIDSTHTPMLSDFGLAGFADAHSRVRAQGLSIAEAAISIRWMAPERIRNPALTPASDVYSFARTILEIMTGEKPFPDIASPIQLIGLLEKGELWPTYPVSAEMRARGLTDRVWGLLSDMWSPNPDERPTMPKVLELLHM